MTFDLDFKTVLSAVIKVAILLSFCPLAYASQGKIQWQYYLLAVTIVSVIVAYVLTARKKNIENTGIRIMLGGVYFWVATFAQLTVLLLIYAIMN